MKQSISETLKKRKYQKPNKFLYGTLVNVVVKSLAKKYGTTFTRKVDMKEYKNRQFILIGNHASRADYIYATLAVGADVPLNFILGRNEFYRSHLHLIVKIANCIPKMNFVPDNLTIRAASKILKNGGNLCFFPEGMSSISGGQQPVALGTGKMLKHYGLPVLAIKIRGGYLTNVKFDMNERPGKVEVELYELFSPDDLKNHTADEIQQLVDKALVHDDYAWNAEKGYSYNANGNTAYHIRQLLYKCPVCGEEHEMTDEPSRIYCKKCGLSIGINDKYEFEPQTKAYIPQTPSLWYDWERRIVRKQVLAPDFILQEKVKLGVLPEHEYLKNQATSVPAGEGVLTLDHSGLTYNGTKNGENFTTFIESKNLPSLGMCTDASMFYTFAANGEFLEFIPTEKESAIKWMLSVEEVHRVNGGKWQNYPWFDYDDLTKGFVNMEPKSK